MPSFFPSRRVFKAEIIASVRTIGGQSSWGELILGRGFVGWRSTMSPIFWGDRDNVEMVAWEEIEEIEISNQVIPGSWEVSLHLRNREAFAKPIEFEISSIYLPIVVDYIRQVHLPFRNPEQFNSRTIRGFLNLNGTWMLAFLIGAYAIVLGFLAGVDRQFGTNLFYVGLAGGILVGMVTFIWVVTSRSEQR